MLFNVVFRFKHISLLVTGMPIFLYHLAGFIVFEGAGVCPYLVLLSVCRIDQNCSSIDKKIYQTFDCSVMQVGTGAHSI